MKGFSLAALSLLACLVVAEEAQVPLDDVDTSEPSGNPDHEFPDLEKPAEKPEEEQSHVHVLTATTFDDFIKDTPHVLAKFYAPWCGHCKMLAPEFERAAETLKDNPHIKLVKVDCNEGENNELCKREGVDGFPTVKAYKNDIPGKSKPYQGARTADDIVTFMVKQTEPTVTKLDKDKYDTFFQKRKIVFVAYLHDDDTESHSVFETVAETMKDKIEFTFAKTAHPEHAESAQVKFPSIVMYKPNDQSKSVYEHDTITVEKFTEFVKIAPIPLVGVVDGDSYTEYMESGIPLAYVFVADAEQKEKYANIVKPLAKKYRGKINFATIDAVQFGAHAPNVNLKQEPWPAFSIQDTVKNFKYPLDQEKELTGELITTFVDDFVAGKIEPTIKSEPIPETQDGPVHVAVAKNFDQLVKDNDKDVLVKFYVPYCGHCKNLAPKYEQLAKHFFDHEEHSTKVVLAKFDCMANDIPSDVEIEGFPTLRLYPAGAKESPIEYAGDRTVQDMAKFIKEKGKHGVEIEIPPSTEESESEAEDDFDDDMFGDLSDMMEDSDGDEPMESLDKDIEETAEKVTEPAHEAAEAAEAVSSAMADEGIHDEL